MSAPIHFLYDFTTDGDGEYEADICNSHGGMCMRAMLVRADGATGDGVADPLVVLSSEADGISAQFHGGTLTPGSPADALYEPVLDGQITLAVTGADPDTDYLLAVWIEPNRTRRTRVALVADENGQASGMVRFNSGGVLMAIGVVDPSEVNSGNNVDIAMTATTAWPEAGTFDVYEDTLEVDGPPAYSLWDYIAPGDVTVTLSGELNEGAELTVVFDIMEP